MAETTVDVKGEKGKEKTKGQEPGKEEKVRTCGPQFPSLLTILGSKASESTRGEVVRAHGCWDSEGGGTGAADTSLGDTVFISTCKYPAWILTGKCLLNLLFLWKLKLLHPEVV